MKSKVLAPWKDSCDKPNQCIQKQRHHFVKKGPHSQSYGFSSSRVQMWKLDHKEGWLPKIWCFQIVVLEKTLESPFDSKIKPVNPKGNQSWIFIEKTDVEAETPILWPADAKSWLIGKDPDAGKDWGQEEKGETEEEKGETEEEKAGWHHQLNGRGFEQTPGDSGGQRSLSCCSPRSCRRVGHYLVTKQQQSWVFTVAWASL